jgi:hypothetical protein
LTVKISLKIAKTCFLTNLQAPKLTERPKSMKQTFKSTCMTVLKAIGLVLTLGVSLTACSQTTWKEEVLLHDGQKIIATRTVDRGGKSEIGQQAPIKQQSVAFTLPITSEKVVWEDKFTEDIGGANFLPMQLEVHKGLAYLVAYPMGCLSYNKWGRPNPPYVVFKYQSKVWQRIPLQELPTVLTTVNLILSSPDTEAKKSGQAVISAEAIKMLIATYKKTEYKTILREPIAGADDGCGEMIHTKNGWEGLGFFSHQPSYDACVKYCDRKGVSQQDCPCKKFFKGEK